ncbi:MAG: HTTM domain-containing protein, partial [Chloroflexota bacterium]|nr:HTTM domain-containing protein [Chloroflexota bacterium]
MPSLSALLAAVTGRRAKQAPITSAVDRIAGRLFERTDIRPLVYFRVAFGAISLWEVYRYFNHGWISRTYIKPKLHFTYSGFSWVRPWPGDGMHVHFLGLGATATLITVGLWYRPAAILFASGFTYVFLLEKARYLNHFYLISLVSWLMVVIPANRAGSLDAWFKPALRSGS